MQLIFKRCKGENCSTEEEFKEWVSKIFIEQMIVNTYFDPEDYIQPIHYFMEETYISLQYGRSVLTNLFIKKNTITLNDDMLGIFTN